MDDIYEVDNRYPEVAEPYEKLRGVRHHGGLDGTRDLAAARRASRIDRIKRGFWSSTAAVVTAVAVLLASPGGGSHAAEPVVTAPTQIETEAPPETVTELPPETATELPPETVTQAPETVPAETEATQISTQEQTDEPFEAPTLTITEVTVNGTDVSPLSYRYAVELNSAETLELSAVVTAENGASLGSDGPYVHSASERSPTRSVALSWVARPTTVTLTLTGVYTEKGEQKTLTARQSVEVPELPFIAPTIRILSARCDDMDPNLVVYSAAIQANSADPLTINVSASANGETYGTEGPIRVTGSATWTDRTFRISAEEDDMVLTMTGSYVEKGVTKTIRVSAPIKESEVFEWPEIEVDHTERGPGDLVRYGFYAVVNSGSGLRVRAQFLDDGGSVVYETGWTDVGGGGSFGIYSVHTGRRANSIRLIGEFEHLGKTYTVEGSDELPDTVTFTAPEVEILSASTNYFFGGEPAVLSFRVRVTMGDAELLPLRLSVITDSGDDISPSWNQSFTTDTSLDVSVPINVPAGETGMYMILSGFYTIEGEEHQALTTATVSVPTASIRPLANRAVPPAGRGATPSQR